MRKTTATQWSWRGDTGWIDYDAKMNLHLETEYLEGVQRITIDGERFVDVSLPQKQIKVKWYCADCEDKDCLGLQRRFDDETKRRAVRRQAEPFLKGLAVAVLFSEDDQAFVEKMMTSHKASLSNKLTKRTKVVVIGNGMGPEDFPDEVKFATENDIPLVTEEWLVECINQKAILLDDAKNYAVVVPKTVVAEEEEAAPVKKAASVVKAPVVEEADDSSAPPPAKKPKLAEIAEPADSMDVEPAAAAPAPAPIQFKSGTRWMGASGSDDFIVPFILTVKSIISGSIEGTMLWPTLRHAETKWRGTIVNQKVTWTEYEIIRGEDDVEVGSEYTGILDGSHLSGSWVLEDLKGTFSADLLEADPIEQRNGVAAASNATYFNTDASYQGKFFSETEFTLKITKREGNIIEGQVSWPTKGYTTNIQGEIQGAQLKFSEVTMADPAAGVQPSLPALYAGVLEDNALASIRGSVATSVGNGTFVLNLAHK